MLSKSQQNRIYQFKFEQAIHEAMEVWTKQTITDLKAAIESENIESSGKLKQSLDFMIHGDDSKVGAKIAIIFEEYGRFQDMRYRYKSPPPVDAMLEWVQKHWGDHKLTFKGVVPGYPKGIGASASTTNLKDGKEAVMKRIANSIAFIRLKPDWQEKKRRSWWNITIGRRIGQLKAMIRTQLERDLAEHLRKEFNLK